ncbi:MAG: hypothetical protein PHH02_04555 [Dehalococcoidales bacterium]|nr:hypothetical protein [Dehalococcoidales bacterium]MDD4322925.1 hypothetical protein [Dehalococcoidales bacterium]
MQDIEGIFLYIGNPARIACQIANMLRLSDAFAYIKTAFRNTGVFNIA